MVSRLDHHLVKTIEPVPAGLELAEDVVEAGGIDVVGVYEQRLWNLITKDLFRYLFSEGGGGDCETQILGTQPPGKLFIFVAQSRGRNRR